MIALATIPQELSWLWRASWEASLLALAVLFVQWVAGSRLSPAWRYGLWCLVIVRLVLPDTPASPFSGFNLEQAFVRQPSGPLAALDRAAVPEHPSKPRPGPMVNVLGTGEPDRVERHRATGAYRPAVEVQVPRLSQAATSWDGLPWMFVLWMIGAVMYAASLLAGSCWLFAKLRRTNELEDTRLRKVLEECQTRIGVRWSVKLMESSSIASPAVFGILWPRLLLPPGLVKRLSEMELQHVVMHELAHIRRQDVLQNWCLVGVQILHWFNPVVWLVMRRMRADRELACDALALSHMCESDRLSYGRTILRLLGEFAKPLSTPAVVGIMEEQLLMARRLAAIVRYKPAPSRPVLPLALFCSLALVFLTGNGAAVDGGNAPAPRPSAADFPVPAGSGAPQLQESDADLNTQFVPLDLSKVAEEPSHKSWPALPKGPQTLNGVPFQIDGWVQLAAVRDDATGTGFPVELTGLRVGRQIDRVHLINFTEYFTGYDTPVACLAFRYTNGEWRSAEMRYGVHTRDWYSGTGPAVGLLTDPDSRIAWTGRSRDAAQFGKLLRLYHTAFENPLPAQPVESIEIISSLSAAIPTILAITVEEAATRLHDSTEEEGTSQPGDLGTLKLKSIDAARGEPVAHARYTIKTGPAGSGMTLGTFRSDATGEATVLFPPGPWSQLMITAQASDDLIGTSTVQLPAPRRSKLPAFLIPQYGGSRWPPRSLDAGETLESTVEMVRTESMGARVIDKNGQPAAGIRIVIQSFSPDLNGSLQAVELDSVVTSQDGVWTSSYIPVGTQHLRLRLIPPDGGELEIELDWSHPSKLPPFPRTALETETAVIGLTP